MKYTPLLKGVLAFFASIFALHLVSAQGPYMIKDINASGGGAHSNPHSFIRYKGSSYFSAESVGLVLNYGKPMALKQAP